MKRLLSALLVASSCVATYGAQAQIAAVAAPAVPNAASHGKPTELSMKRAGSTSIDLRKLPPGKVDKHERIEPEPPEITPIELPGSLVQPAFPIGGPSAPAPSPSASFLGLDFATWGAGHPPDTNGDVGPTYFIETVNTSIGIYDKATGTRVAAFTFNALMHEGDFGNLCDTSNDGDPVVLYDSFEDRWVITDFAFQTNAGGVIDPPGVFQCFAVSKSGDPVSGGWNFYSINTTGGLGDYPKVGVWPDGIYLSVNLFNDALNAFFNPRLYALNKAQMYAGAPSVQVVTFDAPAAEFTVIPANARLQTGTPPAGSPNYFAVVAQFLNAVSVYKFHVDWNSISTSTLTGPFVSLTATNWSQFTGANGDVPSPANSLDTLYPRLMVQNQYTNIGGIESLWDSHTVGASGATSAQAAVRYYQVKVTGGTVEANATQAFTWSPDATVHRFMPSVAVDRAGNMALGYSASSATLNPAIRYAGRLAGDAANTISQTETSLIEGTGSQSGNCGTSSCVRWGDYSSMSLDPDGCTFWMSNEYYAVNGLNWQTRIGAFKYPSCTTVASGSVQGTVTATAGGAPISGATVALGSRTTTTNGSGGYSFSGVPSGTYPSLTASASGFNTGTASNIVVTGSGTTTQNFSLATAATSACPADTTQADFQKGIPTNTDLVTSPGSVILENPPVLDQQNTSVTNSGPVFTSTSWFGQTFKAGATGALTRVDLDLFCSGCTGTTPNITVSIRATSSNLPTGADLASATISGFSSGSASFLSAMFASPPSLTAGTVYAIVVRAVSNPSAGTYAYVVSTGSPYAGGRGVTSSNSGSSWSGQTTDVGFKTYVGSGFTASGDLISSLKDSNPASGNTPVWTTLTSTTSTPANTSLKFQAAASNSQYGPFSFVGPDGTASTFYTTSGGSLAQFAGKRYLQYRAYLATTSTAVTPTLSDVTVCYSNSSGPVADLSITKSDGVATATPGGSVSYTITASNAGPGAAPGSTVTDTFPASLTCTWTCTGSAGGTCTASGSGDINDSVNLPSGGSVTYAASCTISSSATGSLANTATVAAPGGVLDPNPLNDSAADTDTLAPQANLGVTNSDGVTTATPGGSLSYTITASNPGPSAAPGSNVSDTFPAALTCTWTCVGSNGGTCTASGSGNINDTVNLPKTGNVTYTASCNISAAATGSLANTATVATAVGVTDPTPGNNSATDNDTLAPQANLGITNTDGVITATPGGSVTYTITASNASGPSAAPGSNVSDTFPAALTCTWTCVGSNGGTCTASGSGNINDTVNLPKTGNITYTASCNISASATGSLANTATVSTGAGVTDPTSGNNSALDTDTLAPQADLSITNSDGVTTAAPGGSVSYTITAANTSGPSAAPASSVTDAFPASLTCTWTCAGSNGGTCTASGSGNISDMVNLPKTGNVTYTASCNISAAATGSLANTATVSPAVGVTDPTPGNNSATDTDTLTPQANLSIINTDGVTTATPGGSVNYTITAANTSGPSAAPASTVTDTFPASLTCTWTCAGSNGGTCTASGSGNISDTVNLPKTGNVTYTASCSISAAATGTVANTATVAPSASVTDPTPGNNSATDTDTLTPQANLSITNSDGVTTAIPGGSVTYTITAANSGPSDAPGSSVNDTFPASLTCTWTCVGSNGGTCTASGSGNISDAVSLPKTGNITYTASCSISAAATGSLTNTASVAPSASVTDPTPANNSATDTDTLTPQANLALTLTDNRSYAQIGDVLDYVIEVTNPSGPSTAVATVTDTLPAQLTSGSWVCAPTGSAACSDGTGNTLNDTATLPVGGKASYVYTATVQSAGAIDQLVDSASTAMLFGSDPASANNSAIDTDTVVIFRDGFEGSAAQVTGINAAGAGNVSAQLHVDSGLLGGLGIVPVEIASGRGADGKRLFTLQLARFGHDIALRTLTIGGYGESRNSAWQTVDLDHHVLEFAWQSASSGRADGYFAVAAGGTPVLVDGRTVLDRLTYLHITVENQVPWLILIEH